MTSSSRRYSVPQAVMGIALCFLLMGAVYYYSAMPPGSPEVEAAARAEGRAVVRPPEPHATVKRVRKPIEEPEEVDCRSVQCSGPPKDCPRGQGAFKHGGKTADGCCPLWECHDIGQAPHEFRVLLRTSKVGVWAAVQINPSSSFLLACLLLTWEGKEEVRREA
jgi:hypothetical protein